MRRPIVPASLRELPAGLPDPMSDTASDQEEREPNEEQKRRDRNPGSVHHFSPFDTALSKSRNVINSARRTISSSTQAAFIGSLACCSVPAIHPSTVPT
jgi:hypothetical protein